VIALQASSVLMWLVAAGFGIPAPFVASHLPLIAILRLALLAAGWSALR
jgi:hypothetical protein